MNKRDGEGPRGDGGGGGKGKSRNSRETGRDRGGHLSGFERDRHVGRDRRGRGKGKDRGRKDIKKSSDDTRIQSKKEEKNKIFVRGRPNSTPPAKRRKR